MTTFRRLLVLPLLVACRQHHPVGRESLQELTPLAVLPSDSAILARLQQQHACVPDLPPVSSAADNLAPSTRCTLVATALAAIRDVKAAPEIVPELRRFRLEQVQCIIVQGEAYRNEVTHALELPRWSVDFYSDRQRSVGVEIDRLTGDAHAYRLLNEFGFTAADICARAS